MFVEVVQAAIKSSALPSIAAGWVGQVSKYCNPSIGRMLKSLDREKQAILCLEIKAFDYFGKEIIPVRKVRIIVQGFALPEILEGWSQSGSELPHSKMAMEAWPRSF